MIVPHLSWVADTNLTYFTSLMDEVVGAVEQLLGVERLGVSFVARAVEIGVLQPVAANVLPQRRITPDELGRKKLFAD